jgi:hypothetical protein
MGQELPGHLRTTAGTVAVLSLLLAGNGGADVWDAQTVNDDTAATANELVHGTEQVHDLGAVPGFARSMRFHNPNGVVVEDKWIRVRSGGCTATCTPNDMYRLRFYETTAAVPRFNDSGTQVTFLILQNPTDGAIAGTAYFWDASGTLLASPPFDLAPRSTLILDTSAVPGLAGQSGSVTIGHDGRYGDLSGKAVSVEPARASASIRRCSIGRASSARAATDTQPPGFLERRRSHARPRK